VAEAREVASPGRGAFDEIRPPDPALIDQCVHCGFCLPTCPTYALWGEEMDSPRGRIVLMQQGLTPSTRMSDLAVHFDRCLGCMACVTACPSGVRYDRLIEATRPQVERNVARSPRERALRRFVFALFPHPERVRRIAPFLVVYRRLRLDRLVRRLGLLGRFPRLAALERLAPRTSLAETRVRLPALTPAAGPARGTVGLLQGCVQRVFFSRVNEATLRVLAAEGFEVIAPEVPRCCGALQLHAGEEGPALELARRTIEAFEGCGIVVANAAGCGSAMKDYSHLLADDPAWADRAAAFSAKVRDVTEVLASVEPRAERHPLAVRIAYHDACHLAHAQGVRTEPRALLRAIPGVDVLEPPDWELCCGSAGIYNVLQPQAADRLGRRKAENLLGTGAEVIAAGNPGCALQISAHLEALGHAVPIRHPIELLDASIRGVAW
jgi:glycolate oxidase iron-sulfur subunit